MTQKKKQSPPKQGKGNSKKELSALTAARKQNIQLGLFAAALGILLYAATFNYSYTLDDFSSIKDNWLVKRGFAAIGTLLQTPYRYGYWSSGDELYRPLSLIMFAIEWQFSPNSPAVGHTINIILYGLTGFMLYQLLYKVFRRNTLVAFIATMLFMAHPVHTEVVSSIKSRDEIICLCLCIATIYWLLDFLESGKKIKILLAGCSFFLALLAKETASTMLAIIPLIFFISSDSAQIKKITAMIPLLLATGVYLAMRAFALHGIVNTKPVLMVDNVIASAAGFPERMATVFYVLGRYLWMLFVPIHLSVDYSYPEITLKQFSDYRVLASLLCYLLLGIYALYAIRKKNIIAFGILFFLLSVSIVSNLVVLIGTVMADRLLYIPSLGFCIALAFLMTLIFKPLKTQDPKQGLASFFKNNAKLLTALSLILILFSIRTILRIPVWKDSFSVSVSGVEDSPNSSRANYLHALELKDTYALTEKDSLKREEYHNKALEGFNEAIRLYPGYSDAYREMGIIYYRRKNYPEAIKYYDLALKNNPYDYVSYNNKGVILSLSGNEKEGMELFKKAVNSNPRFSKALDNLGKSFLYSGDIEQALSYFKMSLEYSPDDKETLEDLVSAYTEKKDPVSADFFLKKLKQTEGKSATP